MKEQGGDQLTVFPLYQLIMKVNEPLSDEGTKELLSDILAKPKHSVPAPMLQKH